VDDFVTDAGRIRILAGYGPRAMLSRILIIFLENKPEMGMIELPLADQSQGLLG